MKALPWIAVIVLATIAAVMFRYYVVEVKTVDGKHMATRVDRWTGGAKLIYLPTPTPTPSYAELNEARIEAEVDRLTAPLMRAIEAQK